MKLETIVTENAPAAIGPYSQAVSAGEFLFVSGQLPIDPKTGALVEDDIATQTKQALENISCILSAAGSSLSKAVTTTVFLKDMAEFAEMNKVYASYFQGDLFPARAAVQVAALPKDARVEIDVIAVR